MPGNRNCRLLLAGWSTEPPRSTLWAGSGFTEQRRLFDDIAKRARERIRTRRGE